MINLLTKIWYRFQFLMHISVDKSISKNYVEMFYVEGYKHKALRISQKIVILNNDSGS